MAARALLNSFFGGAVRGFSDLTSSHSWQEKRKDSEAAAAEKVEKPKDFCSHCRLIFFGAVRTLSGTEFFMAVRGFSDLTSSHPWQEKREDSEAAAAEKVEEPKGFCSHCFFWL